MTGKELIFKVLNHEEAPRLPWVPFVGVHAGKLVGYDATEMLTDKAKILEGIGKAIELYNPDGIPVLFDLQIEAEILGCEMVWAKEGPPSVKTHPLADTNEIPCDCTLPQPTDGRIPLVVDVMKDVKAKYGEEIALYGLICGPFTLASHLRGSNIFMDMYDDEQYVRDLMNFSLKAAKKMTDYYIDAGMDIIAVVDPLISQISPDHFEEYFLEPFAELFRYIKEKGAYSSFFVCGDATRNIEMMCRTNPDSISVDENIKMPVAKEITDRYNIAIGGNIPLTTVMLHGNQQDNMKAVIGLIDSLSKKNLIISPGCDMPYAVPFENTVAAAQAVRETESCRKMVENYESSFDNIEVALPDYTALKRPFVEAFTLDSETCAACTYIMAAVNDAKAEYGDKIDIIEYKFTIKENIARCIKMGVKQLPSIYINGKLAYSSIIPSRAELNAKIDEAFSEIK